MFTRSAIAPPKVNRFGLNLEHSGYIVGAGPGRFWAPSHTVATAGEPGDFFSGEQRTISPITRRPNFTKFKHNTSIGALVKTVGTKS